MWSNAQSLLSNVGTLTPLTLAGVALAGVLVGIAPSSFPLMAIAGGFGAAADGSVNRHRGLALAVAFVSGIVTIDTTLGAIFGLAGFAVMRLIAPLLAPAYALLALLLALIGLALLRVIRVRMPVLTPTPRTPSTMLGAYLLGLPFGLSSCPACTPLLLPVVGAAAFSADPVLGGALMFSFGVGRGLPVAIAGELSGMIKRLIKSWILVEWIERAGGVLFLLAAAYFTYIAAYYAGWVAR